MEIRNFKREDAGEAVDLWNTSLREDKTDRPWYGEDLLLTEDKLQRVISNPNFDPRGVFIVDEGQRMVGFGRGVVKSVKSYEEEELGGLPGYLEGLIVKPSFRGKGIGTRLLQSVESYIQAQGKDTVQISRYRSGIAGVYVLPETPEYKFLLKRGYQPAVREMRLKLTFKDFFLRDKIIETRERLKQEGIEVKYYEDRYRDSFSGLMEKHFQGWWYYSYKPNLEKDKPLPVLIAVDEDRVVGFIGFVAVGANKRAGFSPGVDPAYRKRGIGKVLTSLWAKEVKGMGAEESVISVGTENHPARSIYFEMGYKSMGEFCPRFTKKL